MSSSLRGADAAPGQRGQGVHAGLSLDEIVDAASSIDPSALTMRAVAMRLGVDHKALNHHVTDRDTLVGLVAWRAFSASFTHQPRSADSWQDACRGYARAFVEAAIAVGPLARHLTMQAPAPLSRFVEKIEDLIARLLAAGFTDEQALRAVALLGNLCLAHAQDVVMASAQTERPRRRAVQTAIDHVTRAKLPHLARIMAADIDTYADTQLELSLTIFVNGLDSLLGPAPKTTAT